MENAMVAPGRILGVALSRCILVNRILMAANRA